MRLSICPPISQPVHLEAHLPALTPYSTYPPVHEPQTAQEGPPPPAPGASRIVTPSTAKSPGIFPDSILLLMHLPSDTRVILNISPTSPQNLPPIRPPLYIAVKHDR